MKNCRKSCLVVYLLTAPRNSSTHEYQNIDMQNASTRGFEGPPACLPWGHTDTWWGMVSVQGWPARTFRFHTMDTGYHGWHCCRHCKCHTDNQVEVKILSVKSVLGLYLFCPLVMPLSVSHSHWPGSLHGCDVYVCILAAAAGMHSSMSRMPSPYTETVIMSLLCSLAGV